MGSWVRDGLWAAWAGGRAVGDCGWAAFPPCEHAPTPRLGPTFFNTLALYRLAAFAFRNMSYSSSTALACRSGLREGA